MAGKDVAEKTLEAYNDVFADIVNVLLFHGEQIVKEDSLEDAVARYHYKADLGKIHEMERDALKYWNNNSIRIAFFGMENQTKIDENIPVRCFGYDGAEYRRQLIKEYNEVIDEETKEKKKVEVKRPLCPVITLVLYFGYEKRWDKSLHLCDCINIPEKLKPFVNDYKVNLFELAFLPDETVKKFQSDFKFVVDYLVQMKKTGSYTGSRENIRHVHEVLELFTVMTDDIRFKEVWDSSKEEVNTMCSVLDEIESRGEARGKIQGEERIITMNNILLDTGRLEDLKRASQDRDYREKLLAELFPEKAYQK